MLARLPLAWVIEVHLDAPLSEIAPRVPATMAELTADGTGTRLEMRADSLEWVAGVLAGLGADFRVIRPDELREQLAQLASRLVLSSHA
jgi:predicted DNA-binding transcriptional regulator YafY